MAECLSAAAAPQEPPPAVTQDDAWLRARLTRDELPRRLAQIDAGFRLVAVVPVGLPYLVASYSWEHRRFGVTRRERLCCAVDRCQGVSTTLEAFELGSALADARLPPARLDSAALEHRARRHVMQMRRHQLKRRDAAALALESLVPVRKPLWRVEVEHARHGRLPLLIDALNGGYLLLNE